DALEPGELGAERIFDAAELALLINGARPLDLDVGRAPEAPEHVAEDHRAGEDRPRVAVELIARIEVPLHALLQQIDLLGEIGARALEPPPRLFQLVVDVGHAAPPITSRFAFPSLGGSRH